MKKVAPGILPMIVVDRRNSKALHRQVYEEFRSAILLGKLRPRQRIPSTRVLAKELGISRFPVLNAYTQLLAEGYFESRVGAGTVVSRLIPDRLTSNAPIKRRVLTDASKSRPVARLSATGPGPRESVWVSGSGPFTVGQVAIDEFPIKIWSALIVRHSRRLNSASFQYGDPRGSKRFREGIAAYLRSARSLQCEADQVIVVSGSQQALEISARVLVDPQSSVWFEEPGYRLARDAFALTGCHLVPVPVDAEGMDIAAGIKRCAHARAAIVTPSHQFPLGVTMSASRRLQFLDWSQKVGSWIIEDDYDSEFRYDCSPIAALQGMDGGARVIYIGTFSKVLSPSLRLGYIVLPMDLVDRFLAFRQSTDISPPQFYQDVLADFFDEGHFARHTRRMRVLYSQRRNTLVNCIAEELGSEVEVVGSAAGMHLTLILKEPRDDMKIGEEAARQGLWLWPLSACYLSKTTRPGFVLGFGSTSIEEIPQAVRKLRNLLHN